MSGPSTVVLLASLLLASAAPFQCGSEPPPVSGEREDTPGEALKRLADELGKSGDREGRKKTLKFLIERYPRSREAKEAEVELAELGGAPSTGASASASAAVSSSAAP